MTGLNPCFLCTCTRTCFRRAPQPTWETVRYMVSVIQYGGRITDDFDQLLMDTFAEKYFHQGVLQVGPAARSPAGAGRAQASACHEGVFRSSSPTGDSLASIPNAVQL